MVSGPGRACNKPHPQHSPPADKPRSPIRIPESWPTPTAEICVSLWLFILITTASGGAFIVWHNVSKTKHMSEEMLHKYREMLGEARARKAKALAEEAMDAEQAEKSSS